MIGVYERPEAILAGRMTSGAAIYTAGYTPARIRLFRDERTWLNSVGMDQYYGFPTEDWSGDPDTPSVTSSGARIDRQRQHTLLRRHHGRRSEIAKEPRELGSRVRDLTEEEWGAILAP